MLVDNVLSSLLHNLDLLFSQLLRGFDASVYDLHRDCLAVLSLAELFDDQLFVDWVQFVRLYA